MLEPRFTSYFNNHTHYLATLC